MIALGDIPFLRRLRLRRLRRVLRGYRYLKESNKLERIWLIKSLLSDTAISGINGRVSRLIFGAAADDAERVVRQYLLLRVAGLELNDALLRAAGKPGAKVVHPLPSEWRTVVRAAGFHVASFRSALMWAGFVFLRYGYGVLALLRATKQNIGGLLRQTPLPSRYVYFAWLTGESLPQPSTDGRSHDIFSWYQQWDGRIRDLDALCHGVVGGGDSVAGGARVARLPSLLPPLGSFPQLLRFVGHSLAAVAIAGADLLRGRWWHALLLSESFGALQMRVQDPRRFAREYLLHNSSWIYRPLWTYEAMRHGSRISFYFYSCNVEGFQPPDGQRELLYGWRAANWPHYLVWDAHSADFVRRSIGPDANISIVGPIWFTTSPEEMPQVGPRTIAVFDVTPIRRSRYARFGLAREYYVPETSVAFLKGAHQAAKANGFRMLWKQKRRNPMAHAGYRYFAEQLAGVDGVTVARADISAMRVIEQCELVISMPFTSTALIARHLGKPSCYYDATGQLRSDDHAAHGIPILQDVESLAAWVKDHSVAHGPPSDAKIFSALSGDLKPVRGPSP